MSEITSRDIEYRHDGTRMIGCLWAPAGATAVPTIVLVHDAFGLGDEMIANALRFAELGFAVFAADVWGERTTPTEQSQIGPLMGAMVGDRPRWLARVAAAHETASAQPEVDASALVSVGYCFGGSSALEHLRTGGAVRGVVSIHGGLDLLEHDWSAATAAAASGATASARVLLCTGADDPMATAQQREQLQQSLSGAGIDWETDLYSGTTHAFTSLNARSSPKPELFAYNARSAARAWDATERFLRELFPDVAPARR